MGRLEVQRPFRRRFNGNLTDEISAGGDRRQSDGLLKQRLLPEENEKSLLRWEWMTFILSGNKENTLSGEVDVMKITDDILKALQKSINSFGSMSEFSRRTNVRIETLSRFLSRKTLSIRQETWDKLYPLLQPHLNTPREITNEMKAEPPQYMPSDRPRMSHDLASLNSDEKILLDAFAALPKELQNRKLLEIVELAKQQLQSEKN